MRTEIKHLFLFFCLSLSFVPNSHSQLYSQLWGKKGESWDREKIPDFTHAGYKEGKKEVPHYKVNVDVTNFGAVGDGVKDNTIAFRNAISQCKSEGAVYIPAGTYLLSDSLIISKSGVCIRGAGRGKTKIFFSKGLEELYPDYNKHNRNQTYWSWSGAMILFSGDIEGSGIEDLSVVFPDSIWAGHNFHERCYNGIGFSNKAHNGWVRNVELTGCDLGMWIERSSHHITVENWILNFGPKRGAEKLNGHHGVNIYGGYNLLQDFEIKGKFHHDLSIESENSMFNVFRNGKGTDLCIDHHNHAQRNNLFTNIDAGLGSRLFFSGGNDTPRGVCFNETFWNIRAQNFMNYCDNYDTKNKHSLNNVCVGIKTQRPSELNNIFGNWFETIDPTQLFPADLYQAQLNYKKK